MAPSSTVKHALAVLLVLATHAAGQMIPTATARVEGMNALTPVGCFSTPAPMVDHGPYTFQSKGNCQEVCYQLKMPVMGLVNGTNCYCGTLIPPNITQVSDSKCSTPCNGIDTEMCGGANFWTVYLTGFTRNKIGNLDPSSLTMSSSATGPPTAVVTDQGKSKGSSTIGIAVGVVVGLVVLAAIIAGVVIFLRRKRRREEEEHRHEIDAQGFVNGGKGSDYPSSGSTVNDSRLDPNAMQRRQSTGSIADNQDYSRRILQVTNPDGF